MGKLTARQVQTAGPGKHEDGDGLRLVVAPTGGKKWVLRLTAGGKRREMGLGSFPVVSLAEARTKAADARRVAADGRDPIEHRASEAEAEAAKAAGIPTFTQAAARFIRAHRHGWSNPKHARQWCATLKTYDRSVIGSKPVDQVTTEDVLKILSGIWNTKTETAKRVQGRVENVLDFAAARKWRDESNPARWRGHLDKRLPKPTKVTKVIHHPAMPYQAVPGFMVELEGKEGVSALALRFLILTACRTGEVTGAQWPEFDLEAAVWTVPAERMKAKREHRVPLSNALPRVDGNPFVFPGARYRRPVSNMAMLQQMRGMGYGVGGDRGDYVPHGFRSAFRD